MRRIERRWRDGSDGGRSVALAELQLEAQQLADAQRRVADETGQVEVDNRSRESLFRLADEKDDLADRVDTLNRGLEDLAPDRSTADPADGGVRAARDELERAAVGRRMREGADSLRWSVAGHPLTSTERDGDGLGDEETQRLAAQMEAARKLRQSLERLRQELEGRQPQQAAAQSARAEPQAREADRPSAETQGGSSAGGGALAGLRREYLGRLEQSRELLDALRRQSPELDRDFEQWARSRQSVSAPGTEAFKQDFEHWDSLRRNLETALQQFEAETARALAAGEVRDRPSAGLEEPLPERYRRLVDQYYRALATAPESAPTR